MAELPVLENQAGDQGNTVVARMLQAGSISTCSIHSWPATTGLLLSFISAHHVHTDSASDRGYIMGASLSCRQSTYRHTHTHAYYD